MPEFLSDALQQGGFYAHLLVATAVFVAMVGLERAWVLYVQLPLTLDEAPRLHWHTAFLSAAANVAMLVGLLGTLDGLIMGFECGAHPSQETRQTLLAASIAMALSTTLAGLVIALPSKVLAGVYQERAHQLEGALVLAEHRDG